MYRGIKLACLVALSGFALVGCANEAPGRGEAALSGEVPRSDASASADVEASGWGYTIYEGLDGRAPQLVIGDLDGADELLGLVPEDLDGDGDYELTIASYAGEVPTELAVEELFLSDLEDLESLLGALDADCEDLVGESIEDDVLAAVAGAEDALAAAVAVEAYGICALDADEVVSLCVATATNAALCADAGTCDATAIEASADACAAALTGLVDGAVACVEAIEASFDVEGLIPETPGVPQI